MREIKFRAWDEDNKCVFKVKKIEFTEEGVPYKIISINGMPFDVEDVILMQFTGLKDKNGKEIYEGDIADVCGINCLIIFEEGSYYYSDFDGKWIKPISLCERKTHHSKIEVVGNVYENPELISGVERE